MPLWELVQLSVGGVGGGGGDGGEGGGGAPLRRNNFWGRMVYPLQEEAMWKPRVLGWLC